MTTTMNRRHGITLLEVLVAIFVMAIGMLALLTLFPLGALTMAQAIKDNRCQQCSVNAAAASVILNARHDRDVVLTGDAYKTLLDNILQANKIASYDGPGRPMIVDPHTATISAQVGTPLLPLLARQAWEVVPRFNLSRASIIGPAFPYLWFTLTDDVEFDPVGQAKTSGNAVTRTGRYTWSYLLRRQRYNDPSLVDLTVIVYSNRPRLVPPEEQEFRAVGTQGDSTLVLVGANSGEKPALRRGTWLLDTTPESTNTGGPFPTITAANYVNMQLHGPIHSYFYRVVASSEITYLDSTNTLREALRVEVQPPLRVGLTEAQSRVVVMKDVAEVFEKGPGREP